MSLLKSLFTEHLATKFMALLLAIVLFAFVHQSLVGSRHIREIVLEFELSKELRDTYTVLTPSIQLRDLGLQGKNEEVDLLAAQFDRNPSQTIEIDDRFLRLQARGTIRRIPINEAFLHQHKILPEEIRVTTSFLEVPLLHIEENRQIQLKLVLAPGMERFTAIEEDNFFEGTLESGARADVGFRYASAKVRAPPSAFRDGDTSVLHLRIPSVDEFLRKHAGEAGQLDMNVSGIDWDASGLNADLFRQHATLTIAGQWVSVDEFLKQIQATFAVRDRKVRFKLPLTLLVLGGKDGATTRLDGYEVLSTSGPAGSVTQQDYDNGQCAEFLIRGPKSFTDAELTQLVLVLALSRARERDGQTIDVPIYLDVMNPETHGDLLRLVEIEMGPDPEVGAPYVRFKKKQ